MHSYIFRNRSGIILHLQIKIFSQINTTFTLYLNSSYLQLYHSLHFLKQNNRKSLQGIVIIWCVSQQLALKHDSGCSHGQIEEANSPPDMIRKIAKAHETCIKTGCSPCLPWLRPRHGRERRGGGGAVTAPATWLPRWPNCVLAHLSKLFHHCRLRCQNSFNHPTVKGQGVNLCR